MANKFALLPQEWRKGDSGFFFSQNTAASQKSPPEIMKLALKILLCVFLCSAVFAGAGQPKKIAVVSGGSIHYWGDHENELMGELVSDMLKEALAGRTEVKFVNLAAGAKIEELEGSDAVVVFGEGEAAHPLKGKMQYLKKLNEKGTSFGVFHYALMFGENDSEEVSILDSLIGGHYQTHWSVNPYYDAKFKKFANHPAARGVKPFEIYDEWHFNMKFSDNPKQKITHLAVVVPPDKVRKLRFGPNTGNEFVRKNLGREEAILWLCENPNSTRGFGCTGGHAVWTLAHPDFRKLILNSIAWLAKIDIPEAGFTAGCPSLDEIASKIKKPKRPDYEYYFPDWKKAAESWGVQDKKSEAKK